MNWRSISALVCVIYISVCIAENYDEDEKYETALRMIEQMAETRKGLSALKQVIDSIDGDLQKTQKRTCALGGGMSHHCAAALLDSRLEVMDWLKSGLSPGKRSGAPPSELHSVEKRKVKDLTTKRKGLDVLKRILKEMDADLVMEQKRTCQVNLGGHCATESAASVADQWHYLNSPLSPGRKRRDTTLYKKLVGGRLLQ